MNEELDVASVSVSVAVESTIQYMCDTTRNEILLLKRNRFLTWR